MTRANDKDDALSAATDNAHSSINKWPEDERPRERLLAHGAHALTDAELLAILLRVGVQGKSAVELGRELIRRFGSLQAMMSAPLSAWDGIKGLGAAKIAQLQAALELGGRSALPTAREETFLKNTQKAAAMLAEAIRATFDRQRTALLTAVPIGLTDSFGQHPEKLAQWRAFVKRGKLKSGSANLSEVLTRLRDFLMPMVNALGSGESFARQWLPKQGWKI